MKQTKILLTTIAVLLGSVMANAYDFEVDGIYYNIISSTDLTVEVTSGDKKYTGEMIIPTMVNYKSKDLTVTSIGASAFYGCDGLTYISIPDSVRRIGAGAFDNCTSLKEVRIENGYTNLELEHSNHISSSSSNDNVYYYDRYGLFHDCPLERLYVGRDLRYKLGKIYGGNSGYVYFYYYDHSPFYNNTELKVVTIGDCVSTIGESLFAKCSTLENIIISNNVTSIGSGAFSNCSSLRNITIPKNVTLIGNRAFSNCTSLKELHIEDGETELEIGIGTRNEEASKYSSTDYYYSFFHDCPLELIYLGRNLTYVLNEINTSYNSPFEEINTLKSVTIGDSVTIVGHELFEECRNLTYAKIGNNVTQIGDYTFSRCDSLTNISIPRSVTTIGRDAFSYCYSISSITIHNSVERIGFQAFSNCTSLKYVKIEDSTNFLSTGNTSLPTNIFRGCSLGKVYLGRNLSNSPEGNVFSSIDTLTIGSHVTSIAKNTFGGGADITCIYSMCTNPPFINSGNKFTEQQYVYTTIFVPKGTLTAYQTADVWKDFWDIQEYVLDKKFCVNYYIDGELYAVDSVKHGDTIMSLAEPQKENYKFSGWSDIPETMPAEDITITGSFTPNTYTITYMVDEEIFAVDTIAYGDTIALIAEPTQEGYTFSGWSEVPEIMSAEDIIVTGSFVRNNYTITYVVDSVVYATDSITYGDTIILLDEPTQEGYTFSGWSDAPETMPAEDITIEGTFNVNYYALKYIVDNEPFATDSLAYGDTIILREEPQKEDFEFSGWSEAPETMPAYDVEVYGNFIFTSVTDVKVDPEQSQKVVEDNQLFIILPNGRKYNVIGMEL